MASSKGYVFHMRSRMELTFKQQPAVELYKEWLKGEITERGAMFTDPFTRKKLWITFEGVDYIEPIEWDFSEGPF